MKITQWKVSVSKLSYFPDGRVGLFPRALPRFKMAAQDIRVQPHQKGMSQVNKSLAKVLLKCKIVCKRLCEIALAAIGSKEVGFTQPLTEK